MGFTSRDMYAKVDIVQLHRAVTRSELSYQEIADDATDVLRKIARKERRKNRGDKTPEGVSKGLIGQLMTGRAKRTHELRAVAIERALGVPKGDIFLPQVARGVDSMRRLRRAG